AEDYYNLYDAIFVVHARMPETSVEEARRLAHRRLMGLLERGLIALFRRPFGGPDSYGPVDPDDSLRQIDLPVNWEPSRPLSRGDQEILFRATEKGQEALNTRLAS